MQAGAPPAPTCPVPMCTATISAGGGSSCHVRFHHDYFSPFFFFLTLFFFFGIGTLLLCTEPSWSRRCARCCGVIVYAFFFYIIFTCLVSFCNFYVRIYYLFLKFKVNGCKSWYSSPSLLLAHFYANRDEKQHGLHYDMISRGGLGSSADGKGKGKAKERASSHSHLGKGKLLHVGIGKGMQGMPGRPNPAPKRRRITTRLRDASNGGNRSGAGSNFVPIPAASSGKGRESNGNYKSFFLLLPPRHPPAGTSLVSPFFNPLFSFFILH